MRDNHVSFGKNIMINPSQPLSQYSNGEAVAYDAYDEGNPSKKFIAIVSGVECISRYSDVPAYDSLSDTAFMRMVGSGVVEWPLDGKQKFVYMYMGGMGDALLKEDEFSSLNWRHPEIVEYFVQPMARILKEMQDRNFHHGSIRVSNIFHGGMDKKAQVILGDCLSVHSLSTQPDIYLPIQKACCDPMGRGEGSIQDDIYAFGIALAKFLRKNDEFAGMSDEQVLRKKMEVGSYAAIIGKERFQASFLEILRGTLHDNPEHRWTLEEIFLWLDGTRLNPSPLNKRKKSTRPLIFNGHKYLYADMLALDIHNNVTEISMMIEDGSLSLWIEKTLNDSLLFDRYLKAVTRIAAMGGVSVNRDYVVSELRMALCPALPIRYKNKIFTYDGLGPMMGLACCKDRDLTVFKEVIMLNLPDHAMVFKEIPQSEMMNWIRLYEACRLAIKNQIKLGYGVELCVYRLAKNMPCISPSFAGAFVNGHKAALLMFEKMSKRKGQIALFLDQHIAAYFHAHNPNDMDRVSYDLNDQDKTRKILGNLKFLAAMQRKSTNLPVPAVAAVFLGALEDAYKQFKNKALREKIKKDVIDAAAVGDLYAMATLLDNQDVLKKDQGAFGIAQREYKALQAEYDEYNRRLAKKSSYGVTNGHDVAALVAWTVSTMISMIVVFAYISGYRMF